VRAEGGTGRRQLSIRSRGTLRGLRANLSSGVAAATHPKRDTRGPSSLVVKAPGRRAVGVVLLSVGLLVVHVGILAPLVNDRRTSQPKSEGASD
jgi:hypothetical protein